jgi:AcrR family transcriptional regulator
VVKHARETLLAAAVVVAREEGLRQLSFGRVAKRAGTNDRTVVYYFPSKEHLVSAVLLTMSLELEGRLSAVGDQRRPGHLELLEAAWPVLAQPDADAVFALFFEASGLAAARVAPYDTVVPALVSAWLDWAEARLAGTGPSRRAEAEAAVALIDGLLLFRQVMGAEAADRAAWRLLGARQQ